MPQMPAAKSNTKQPSRQQAVSAKRAKPLWDTLKEAPDYIL